MQYTFFVLMCLGAAMLAGKAFWFIKTRTVPNWTLALGAVGFLLVLTGIAGIITVSDMAQITMAPRGY